MKFPAKIVLAALPLAVFAQFPPLMADLGTKGAAPIAGIGTDLKRIRVATPTWLGVAISEASMETSVRLPLAPGTGLVVNEVIADSPAAIAGLMRNDVLARLNDQTLVTPKQLQTLVMHRKAGDQVEITYYRKGERRKVVVVLMPRERM